MPCERKTAVLAPTVGKDTGLQGLTADTLFRVTTQHQGHELGSAGSGGAGPRGGDQLSGRFPAGREGSPTAAAEAARRAAVAGAGSGGLPSKPPLAGKPGAPPGPGSGMPHGKPGGQYPGLATGTSGNPGLPGGGGSGEGGQGAYPVYLQQQNQLLARHLQQPMGLPLNRLTPQQTQQVQFQRLIVPLNCLHMAEQSCC